MNCYILSGLTEYYAVARSRAYQLDHENIQKGWTKWQERLRRLQEKKEKQFISDLKMANGCREHHMFNIWAKRRNCNMGPLYKVVKKILEKHGYAKNPTVKRRLDSAHIPVSDGSDSDSDCDCDIELREINSDFAQIQNVDGITQNYHITSIKFYNFDKTFSIIYQDGYSDIPLSQHFTLPYGFFVHDTKFTEEDLDMFTYYGFRIKYCQKTPPKIENYYRKKVWLQYPCG